MNQNNKFSFFLGPCVLESKEVAEQVAEQVQKIQEKKPECQFYFKGSWDKANRSSIESYRGPGLDEGLKLLEYIKKTYSLPTITDFHLPTQAEAVASVVDVLQVPAFLCRQTDMIVEGAKAAKKYNRILKVKKGQFLAPADTKNIVEKASSFLDKDKILLTERGSSFGYNRLVVDMTSFKIMKSFGVRVIHDATHCVQLPGALGSSTGGLREHIEELALAAVVSGADGVFIETHPNPPQAKSDSSTAYQLEDLEKFVNRIIKLKEFINDN